MYSSYKKQVILKLNNKCCSSFSVFDNVLTGYLIYINLMQYIHHTPLLQDNMQCIYKDFVKSWQCQMSSAENDKLHQPWSGIKGSPHSVSLREITAAYTCPDRSLLISVEERRWNVTPCFCPSCKTNISKSCSSLSSHIFCWRMFPAVPAPFLIHMPILFGSFYHWSDSGWEAHSAAV